MHQFLDWIANSWINSVAAWTQFVCPSKFIVSFDSEVLCSADLNDTVSQFAVNFGVSSTGSFERLIYSDIVIANHQIYADWIYIWAFMNYIDRAGAIKIVLKRSLQFIPFIGLGMKVLGFIFVRRDWAKDKIKFSRRIRRLGSNGTPYNLLIFPEGTTMTEQARETGRLFAKEKGFPVLQHVLLPRCTGLYSALLALKASDREDCRNVDGILDLTIGYSGMETTAIPEEFYTLKRLFMDGVGPEQIHINVSYVKIKDIPLDSKEIFTYWLAERFNRKDELLEEFYQQERFKGPSSQPYSLAQSISYWYFWTVLIYSLLFVSAPFMIVICLYND